MMKLTTANLGFYTQCKYSSKMKKTVKKSFLLSLYCNFIPIFLQKMKKIPD